MAEAEPLQTFAFGLLDLQSLFGMPGPLGMPFMVGLNILFSFFTPISILGAV